MCYDPVFLMASSFSFVILHYEFSWIQYRFLLISRVFENLKNIYLKKSNDFYLVNICSLKYCNLIPFQKTLFWFALRNLIFELENPRESGKRFRQRFEDYDIMNCAMYGSLRYDCRHNEKACFGINFANCRLRCNWEVANISE